jgi:hypothetical protein
MTRFGSFWSGILSPYEVSCLTSFASKGHDVVLYSYEKVNNLPAGIEQRDAGEIVDQSYLHRFICNGKSCAATFSDYFRCLMSLKTDLCWIDADMFLLQSFDVDLSKNFLVGEDRYSIRNALLRMNSAAPELKEMIERMESIIDHDVPWAITGLFFAKALRKNGRQITPSLKCPRDFMPIPRAEVYKLLLPEFAEECAEKCRNVKTVHVYNNALDRIGVCKILLPPEGSYLHYLFTSQKQADGFCGVYPVSVIRTLIENWRMLFTGECVGTKALAKQAIPSVARTIQRLTGRYCEYLIALSAQIEMALRLGR